MKRIAPIAWIAAAVVVLVVAGWFRFRDLGRRPMHTDEAVHGVKLGELLETRTYRYDPIDYHGPTLYFLTLPLCAATGRTSLESLTEPMLRSVPAVVGLLLVAVTLAARRWLTPGGALAAGLLLAVSNFFVFFSRYYIQEMLFALFSALALLGGRAYVRRPRAGLAAAIGLCAGLMVATKETAVLSFAAAAAALGVFLLPAASRAALLAWFRRHRPWRHLALAAGLAALPPVLCYTSFFKEPRGLVDAIVAYVHFADRAGGQGHEKPFGYFWKLLLWHRSHGLRWTECLVPLLALAGVAFCAGRRPAADTGPDDAGADERPFVLFLSLYGLLLWIVYSLIPYKTPWLALNFWLPLAWAGGYGASRLVRWPRPVAARALVAIAVLAGAAHLGRQTIRANTRFAADERNPCVYSHTSTDLLNGTKLILRAAAAAPGGRDTIVKIMAPEYWPLPWYLRHLRQVGYWNEIPPDPGAPIVVTDPDWVPKLAPAVTEATHTPSLVGIRPAVNAVILIRNDLWTKLMDESGR